MVNPNYPFNVTKIASASNPADFIKYINEAMYGYPMILVSIVFWYVIFTLIRHKFPNDLSAMSVSSIATAILGAVVFTRLGLDPKVVIAYISLAIVFGIAGKRT